MSKFFRLCSCEFTKVIKKKSTKVMLIILVISLFASAGVATLTKKMIGFADDTYENMDYKSNLQSQIDHLKYEINEGGDSLDEASKNEMLAQIDINEFAIANNINTYTAYWKSDVVTTDMYDSKCKIYNYKSIGSEEAERIEQENYDKLANLLVCDNFSGYIQSEREKVNKSLESGEIEKDEFDDKIYVLNLKEKYGIGKVYDSDSKWKSDLIEEIDSLKANLRAGVDLMSGKALTEKTLQKTESDIKIYEYRLEHNMAPYMSGYGSSIGSTRKVYDYMVGSFSMMVLAVMIIIIAGGSISSEISKGTIKFWSFTPNKRWKILLSKLLVALFILVTTTVLMSLLSSLIGNIFFGSGRDQGYIYVSKGVVHTINYVGFSILYNLVVAIDIFVFLLFAMMLSTVTRSTAASVGISIATYFGGTTIMQIVNLFVKADWVKFIPLNNLSLVDRIFTNDLSYTASSLVSSVTGNIPVGFSLAVLGVCSLLMIVTMFDSFRKRDIL